MVAVHELLRISVHVPAAEGEPARARLLELAPDGFEADGDGEGLELCVYGNAALERVLRAGFESVSTAPVEPGWEERWRAFHRPVRVAGLWVGPPWERPPTGVRAVTIDPGRAFGTGAHATTRATIELLDALPRGPLLDAGCGSGVVAVAAVRLGFGPVVAVDVDPVAVEVARENASRNGVEVDVDELDVLSGELPAADVVVANIELAAVEALLPRLTSPRAIVSGYLVTDELRASGWRRESRVEREGWAADSLARV